MDPKCKVKRKPITWEKQRCLKRVKSRCLVGKDSYVRVLMIVSFRSTLIEENEGEPASGSRGSKKRAGAIIYPDISKTRSTGVDAIEMLCVNNERETVLVSL